MGVGVDLLVVDLLGGMGGRGGGLSGWVWRDELIYGGGGNGGIGDRGVLVGGVGGVGEVREGKGKGKGMRWGGGEVFVWYGV